MNWMILGLWLEKAPDTNCWGFPIDRTHNKALGALIIFDPLFGPHVCLAMVVAKPPLSPCLLPAVQATLARSCRSCWSLCPITFHLHLMICHVLFDVSCYTNRWTVLRKGAERPFSTVSLPISLTFHIEDNSFFHWPYWQSSTYYPQAT